MLSSIYKSPHTSEPHDFNRGSISSPKGYIRELVLFNTLCEITGAKFKESDEMSERAGIDGFLCFSDKEIPVSLKPISYNRNTASPLYETCWATYRQEKGTNDLIFEFKKGAELISERM